MDTSELTILLRNRDQSALKYLMEHYSKALFGIVMRILNNKESSEEVLQETFIKIWQNVNQFDEEKARLFTWMSRIARNTALDKRRVKNYNYLKRTEQLDESTINNLTQEINTSTIDINRLLQKLEPKYASVLKDIYILGYTHVETAGRLGIPVGTVKTRLRKAIVLLRDILKDEKMMFLSALTIIVIIILALWN